MIYTASHSANEGQKRMRNTIRNNMECHSEMGLYQGNGQARTVLVAFLIFNHIYTCIILLCPFDNCSQKFHEFVNNVKTFVL